MSTKKTHNTDAFCTSFFENSNENKLQQTGLSTYNFPRVFHCYISISYYVLFIPYKLEYHNEGEEQYHLKDNLFQKVLCGFVHASAAFCNMLHFNKVFAGDLDKKPSNAFHIVELLFWNLFTLCFINVCWRKKKHIRKIFNLTKTHPLGSREYKKVKWITCMILGFITVLRHLRFLTHYLGFAKEVPTLRSLIMSVRSLYHLNVTAIDLVAVPLSDIAFMSLTNVLMYFAFMMDGFVSMLCICGTYAIYEIVSDLPKAFSQNNFNPDCAENIVAKFNESKSWVAEINGAVQYVFLFEYMSLLLSTPDDMFVTLDGSFNFFRRIVPVLTRTYSCVTIGFAAQIVQKAESFKHDLLKEALKVPEKCDSSLRKTSLLRFLFQSTSSSDFGVRGGNFFVVSYGFIGMTLSFLMTYILVLIQFEVPACQCT